MPLTCNVSCVSVIMTYFTQQYMYSALIVASMPKVKLCHFTLQLYIQVGPDYGRKTMTGFLASKGIRCSEQRVGESLQRVSPSQHASRRSLAHRRMNPVPYNADYFGQKLHVDQNEKLVMYGVTHCCAIDGYSGKIVGFVTTPIKNNIEIYEHLFK